MIRCGSSFASTPDRMTVVAQAAPRNIVQAVIVPWRYAETGLVPEGVEVAA